MAHASQKDFCWHLVLSLPKHFQDGRVLDAGSMDINGNNRELFANCEYTGCDLGEGNNVDLVCPVHELEFEDGYFDTVCSTEMLEHDEFYAESLNAMARMLKPGGLMFFTCATHGRGIHGTDKNSPTDSPFTNGYYKNLSESDVREVLNVEELFSESKFLVNNAHHDLYFWGIKA